MKCLFCNKDVPLIRQKKWTKYCSNLCNKRASFIRCNPNAKSSFNNNPDFWKTETGIGFKWEEYGAKLLGAEHLKFNGSDADLDWDGKKVDVKSCNLYRRKLKRGKPVKKEQSGWWVFNRNKLKPMDFFLCVCLVDDKPYKVLLIPANRFSKKGIVVGHKSKFDEFSISV